MDVSNCCTRKRRLHAGYESSIKGQKELPAKEKRFVDPWFINPCFIILVHALPIQSSSCFAIHRAHERLDYKSAGDELFQVLLSFRLHIIKRDMQGRLILTEFENSH